METFFEKFYKKYSNFKFHHKKLPCFLDYLNKNSIKDFIKEEIEEVIKEIEKNKKEPKEKNVSFNEWVSGYNHSSCDIQQLLKEKFEIKK